ncbi:MAG: S1C family serine protease [Chitinophagaceae bacterium]|jgi:serine protease Do
MEDILLIQAIERYLDGTMLPAEKAYFEELRANNAEIDQMVVEHNMFLHQMSSFSNRINLQNSLQDVHAKLLSLGDINEGQPKTAKAKIVSLYHRYKQVSLVAASVGGVIALFVTALAAFINPVKTGTIDVSKDIRNEINSIKSTQAAQGKLINEVKSKVPNNQKYISGGTGFLIDAKGYLITSAHVLKGNGANVVDNNGNEYKAKIVRVDASKDLAILKIVDDEFNAPKSLPYIIKSNNANLAQEVYTLGYPRSEMVYNSGNISSKTGFNNDTATYQLQLNANPGNSGGPILNNNGEIIGVLLSKQDHAEGISFAVKSKYLLKFIESSRKEDTSLVKIKLPTSSQVSNKNRETQVNKIQSCVFLVKAYGE